MGFSDLIEMHEVVVYLDKDYQRNESFMVKKGTSKIEIDNMVNDRFGHGSWYTYDIF